MGRYCPSSYTATLQRIQSLGCDQRYKYHCMRNKKDEMVEKCIEISWIQEGKCAVYDTDAQLIDSWKCNGTRGVCPQKQYLSNEVMSYSACVPLHTPTNVTDGSNENTSKIPNDGSRFDNNNSSSLSLILGAILALIAVMSIFVITVIYKRRTRSLRNRTSKATKRQKKENVLPDPEEGIPLTTGTDISEKHESTIEETRHGLTAMDRQANEKEVSDPEEEIPLHTWTDRNKERDSKRWETRYDNELYYKTKTYEHIERLIEDSSVGILIVGNPGSGKSVLAEMLHKQFHRKKVKETYFISKYLKSLQDFEICESHGNTKMIYLVDDCFEDWIQYPHLAHDGLEKLREVYKKVVVDDANCLFMTMSKWNYENLDALGKAELDQCRMLEVVDLSTRSFQLDIMDKTGILEYHRRKHGFSQRMDDNELLKVTYPGIIQGIVCYLSADTKLEFEYPLACRLFYSHFCFVKQREYFFNATKTTIRDYVRGLKSGSTEEKHQYCTLVYMALCGGQVRANKDIFFLKEIARVARMDVSELRFDFECCLITQGDDNTYKIVHEEVAKLLFTSFGYAHTTFVIDKCEIDVLLKYVRTEDMQRRDDYHQNGLMIITRNLYGRFTNRLQHLDKEKLKHIIFKDRIFYRKAMKEIKNGETEL